MEHLPSKVVLASGNRGKLKELSSLFIPLGCELVAQSELGVPEPDEPYASFIENALHKARHAAKFTDLPALADDSGICVNALQGRPGVYSARYARMANAGALIDGIADNSDAQNNAQLVRDLNGIQDRKGYYFCVLVLVRHAQDPAPFIADASWFGEVIATPQGEGGFGYDPYFYLPNFGKTVAQLSAQEKNAVSHRAKAAQLLLSKLKNA